MNREDGPRDVRNIAANVAVFGVSALTSVLYTPYLVRNLGVDAYGLVPLATNVAQYLSILTLAVSASVGRNVIAELNRGGAEPASVTWNTALVTVLILGVAAAPLIVLAAIRSDSLFSVPPGTEEDTHWLIGLTLGTFFLTTIASLMEIGIFVRSRFDVRASIAIASTIVRVGLTTALFEIVAPRVQFVGVGLIAGAAFHATSSGYASRRLLPAIRVRFVQFRLSALSKLSSIGGWVVAQRLGTIFFLNVDIVVVNRVLGAERGGEYGLILVWVNFLMALGSAVAAVFSPRILTACSHDRADEVAAVSGRAMRLVSISMAAPIGLVAGFAGPLMAVWQGAEFATLGFFLGVAVLRVAFGVGFQPVSAVFLGRGKVQLPALVQLVLGAFSIIVAYFLARYTELGMMGPIIAVASAVSFKNIIFVPAYAANILGVRAWTFLRHGFVGLGCCLLVAALSRFVVIGFVPDSLFELGAAALLVSIVYVGLAWRFVLSESEREILREIVT